MTEVREVSVQIAKNVIKAAVKEGLNKEKHIPDDDEELEEWVREQMWDARYRTLMFVGEEEASAQAKGETGVSTSSRSAKL